MEHFLKCYLDQFNSLPRNSLHDRRKRYEMVDYISTLIEALRDKGNPPDVTVNEAVSYLIKYHERTKSCNGKVCLMGKYHNILYVAMKLSYLWQLENLETLHKLLTSIFSCENTFERMFVGAIFGNNAPHYIAGWKSDFDNQEENIRALVYFLDRANKCSLVLNYSGAGVYFRLVDVPIENCGKSSPLKIVTQLGLPDKLLIFLRFGATVYNGYDDGTAVEYIMKRLGEFNRVYPYNLVSCLQLLLRATPKIEMNKLEDETTQDYVVKNYLELVDDGILPVTRCGITPPELKHLTRCVIRERLLENFQLPAGIQNLPVPAKLQRYLDIMDD